MAVHHFKRISNVFNHDLVRESIALKINSKCYACIPYLLRHLRDSSKVEITIEYWSRAPRVPTFQNDQAWIMMASAVEASIECKDE